jgi:hypothetical protein
VRESAVVTDTTLGGGMWAVVRTPVKS